MHKNSIRELALQLRKDGYTYTYIAKQTGLSKSTLSGWLTDIPYTPNADTVVSLGRARAAATERKAELRQAEMEEIRKGAVSEIGVFSSRDLLMFGLGLYLGEGNKTHGIVRVANADPNVIKSMIAWFKVLGVMNEQFSVRIHLYPDSDQEQSLRFWSKTISIPEAQFQRPSVDRRTDKKQKKEGKLPHGTLHLSVRSRGRKEFGVLFARKIQALTEVVRDRLDAGLV